MPTRDRARWILVLSRLLAPAYRAEILHDLVEERAAMRARGRGRAASAAWLFGHLIRSGIASRLRRAGLPDGHRSARGPGVARELRQAGRSLRKAPWYAATIVAVTALSMALAATVFAIVDGVLFKPFPYPNPHELYAVSGRFDDGSILTDRTVGRVSELELDAWPATLEGLPVTGLLYSGIGLPDGSFAYGVAVDGSFFEVFGVRPLMGGFRDEHYGVNPPVRPVIISHRVWQQKFGGNPGIVGTLLPAGTMQPPVQIVGVLTPEAFVPPLVDDSGPSARRLRQIDVVMTRVDPPHSERAMVAYARVPRGQLAAASGAFTSAVRAYRDAAPPLPTNLSPTSRRIRAPYDDVDLIPLAQYTSARERPAFTLVFGTVMSLVGLVLLNAGALSIARAHQRIRDLSLRRALGARTRDLLRHALAEQGLLVASGTIAGVIASPLLLAFLLDRLPPGLNLIKEPRIDWRVLVFAGLASSLAAVTVALLSVRVAARRATITPAETGSTGGTHRAAAGRLLLAAQTAVAFGLILGGGLFATSLARIWGEDPGLETRDVAIIEVTWTASQQRMRDSVRNTRARELAERLRLTAGVDGAAIIDAVVLENLPGESGAILPPDGMPRETLRPRLVSVGSGIFETAGIDLVAGRLPTDTELDAGAPVVVVNESLAQLYWPGRAALGQTLRARGIVVQVVGVVRDARLVALDVPSEAVIFAPMALELGSRGPRVIVRLAEGRDALPAIADRVRQLDPQVRVHDVAMLEDLASESIRERRLSAFVASVFAGVALVFVGIGILGLVAMTASRRTREVGIRIALGARPDGVVRQLIREQLVAVGGGLIAGGFLAAWAVRFVQASLYETAGYDPAIWVATVGVILVTTAVGAWIPARRASRVDPVQALREH